MQSDDAIEPEPHRRAERRGQPRVDLGADRVRAVGELVLVHHEILGAERVRLLGVGGVKVILMPRSSLFCMENLPHQALMNIQA